MKISEAVTATLSARSYRNFVLRMRCFNKNEEGRTFVPQTR